jgi:hypothetical protein
MVKFGLAGTHGPAAVHPVAEIGNGGNRTTPSLSSRGATSTDPRQPYGRNANMESMALGVFLLDDHEVVRTGLRALLEAGQDIDVVGEASTVTDALRAFPR